MKCRTCDQDAIGELARDPYDTISESPIIQPVAYCLRCYNERVIAAIYSMANSMAKVYAFAQLAAGPEVGGEARRLRR
jgi:hypothetical protein